MFSEKLQERITMLEPELVQISDEQLELDEKSEAGEARLKLQIENPCILFRNLEKRKLQYFKNKKCADYIMYECTNNGWKLHVFELKRTVTETEWDKMKLQYKGAMQNALAIAGFLEIPIQLEKVRVYSVYRNDKINDYVNPVRIRERMYRSRMEKSEILEERSDWNDDSVKLDFLGRERFQHKRIQLNVETGEGTCEIAEDE